MANQKQNIKTLLRISVNSRLLFNTKSEAEHYLGISDLDNIKSELKFNDYFSKMNERCMELCMSPLKEFIDLYSSAINKFNENSIGIAYIEKNSVGKERKGESDRDRRRRSELRRLLAVKLFIWTYLNHTKTGRTRALSAISNVSYPGKIFEVYYSKATGEELIDVCFTVLLHWSIVKPFESNTYDYNDDDPKKCDRRKKMLELLTLLKKELPEVGIFSAGNLPALDIAIKSINKFLSTGYHPTTAEYWLMLRQIGCAAFLSSQGDSIEAASLETYPVRLPGIWIDNENDGKSRFWVFPDNYQNAFCFKNETGEKWEIELYECFICSSHNNEDREYIVWSAAEESRQIILNGGRGCDGSKINYMYFDIQKDDDGEICDLYLSSMKDCLDCPLPFSEFHRLSSNDQRYDLVKYQISMPHTVEEGNLVMVNVVNALLAVDRDYIYLYDYDMDHIPFAMQIVKEKGDLIRFHYGVKFKGNKKDNKVFHYYNICNVGDHSHIIRIPRNIKNYSWQKVFQEKDLYDRIVYALDNINIDGFVTIYNFGTSDREKIIFFNDFSIGFSIEQLKGALVKKDDKIKASLSYWIDCGQKETC